MKIITVRGWTGSPQKKGIIKRPLKAQTAIKQISPLYDLKYKKVSVKGVKKWYYVFQTLGRAKIEKPTKK